MTIKDVGSLRIKTSSIAEHEDLLTNKSQNLLQKSKKNKLKTESKSRMKI